MTESSPRAADGEWGVPRVVGVLVLLLAAAVPNDPVVALWGRGVPTPSVIVGVALAAVSAVLIPPQILRTAARSGVLALFASAFAVAIAMLVGQPPTSGEYPLDKPVKLVLMTLLMCTAARSAPLRRRMIPAYLAGWSLFVAISLWQYATGQHVVTAHFEVQRISILGMNENEQAFTAGTGIVLLAARAMTGRLRDLALLFGGAASGGLLFVLGNSRGAILGVGVGLLTVFAAERRARSAAHQSMARPLVAFATAVVVVGAFGWWLAGRSDVVDLAIASVQARVEAAFTGGDLGDRDRLARQTIALFVRNPIGMGYGRAAEALGSDAHNDFLRLTAEGGVLAGLLLIAAAWRLARIAWRNARRPGEAGVLGALAVASVFALTGQGLTRTAFWLFFSLVVTLEPDGPARVAPSAGDASAGRPRGTHVRPVW